MPPDQLTISAVIPLYNGAPYIEESIESVFSQTLPADEVIVVDDGSTDNGPAIVERMAETRPITLLRKANGGQSSARNFGIAHSKGRLIALLDQDDIWYPHHLAELSKPFRRPRYPELGWVYANLDEIDEAGNMVSRSSLHRAGHVVHPKRELVHCLMTDMFILPSATLMARAAFNAVGGFDEQLVGFEDDDLFLRMFRAGYDNIYLDKALTKWRIFDGSSSFSKRMAVSRMVYVRKLLAAYPNDTHRGLAYTRDLIVPRFFPWLVREYNMALKSGNADALRQALDDMKFLLPMHRTRMRLVLRMLMPILERPALARMLVPLGTAARPALRRLLR
jgi:glycosyltransferase involved in cell wall biosynthesis